MQPFRQLLDLIGRAVSLPAAPERRARSADGRVEIVLREPADGARTSVRTPAGTLDCPDFELTISLGGPAAQRAARRRARGGVVSTLQNQLALTEREETARAIRILLMSPTLRQQRSADDFELVRRRRVAVTEWFERTLGWSVDVQPRSGDVRLLKVAPSALWPGDDRPARRSRSGAPFDRLRYVLLCVLAAELVTRRMAALGELADAVVHACAVDEELPPFDTGRHQHRKAFVDVLLLLEELGALVAVDGRTEAFADDADSAVLYQVDSVATFLLTSSPVGASQVADGPGAFELVLSGLAEEPGFDGPQEGVDPRENRRRRHQVMRALFDDPVVYRDRLPDDQRAYVESISGRRLMRQAAEIAGFVLEERAEG